MKATKATSRFTGLIGAKYNKLFEALPHLITVEQEIVRAVLPRVRRDATRPLNILDLGCGTGMTTFALCEKIHSATIVGVDHTPVMLRQYKQQIAKQRVALQKKGIKIVAHAADALQYLADCRPGTIDVVVSGFVLHNLPKDVRHNIILEIGRALVPQGRFVNGDKITCNNEQSHQSDLMARFAAYVRAYHNETDAAFGVSWIKHDICDDAVDQRFTEREIRSSLAAAGFKKIRVSKRLGLDVIVVGDR